MIKTENYNIFINDSFENISIQLEKVNYSKIFILTDENTKKHCLSIVAKDINKEFELIEINSGEENKTIQTCCYIWQKFSELGADRKSLLINLGGGVIGDMGGFCASTFKRGFDFINIPTTLLSQVDASVGGKLGVDFNGLKNQIGLFTEPKGVYIYTNFLNTLDKKQVLSGYAEILKHGLIVDSSYWNNSKDLDIYDLSIYENIIKTSVEIKNKVVIQDPFEKGIRKALNFGHTIGHAVETHSMDWNNPLFHGEAVAIGIICESYLSYIKLKMPLEQLEEITQSIIKLFGKHTINKSPKGSPVVTNPRAEPWTQTEFGNPDVEHQGIITNKEDYEQLIELMGHDKKNENSKINFSLLDKIGSVQINQICSKEEIISSLDYYRNI